MTHRILCYDGKPIAKIELLPNNALSAGTNILQIIEGELCCRISPQEGLADIVDVTDDELEVLRKGEDVEKIVKMNDYNEAG